MPREGPPRARPPQGKKECSRTNSTVHMCVWSERGVIDAPTHQYGQHRESVQSAKLVMRPRANCRQFLRGFAVGLSSAALLYAAAAKQLRKRMSFEPPLGIGDDNQNKDMLYLHPHVPTVEYRCISRFFPPFLEHAFLLLSHCYSRPLFQFLARSERPPVALRRTRHLLLSLSLFLSSRTRFTSN